MINIGPCDGRHIYRPTIQGRLIGTTDTEGIHISEPVQAILSPDGTVVRTTDGRIYKIIRATPPE